MSATDYHSKHGLAIDSQLIKQKSKSKLLYKEADWEEQKELR